MLISKHSSYKNLRVDCDSNSELTLKVFNEAIICLLIRLLTNCFYYAF
jgi:hypothetical protein